MSRRRGSVSLDVGGSNGGWAAPARRRRTRPPARRHEHSGYRSQVPWASGVAHRPRRTCPLLGLLYGGFRVATGPLPAFISRLPLSIRWKILAGICFMGGLLLLVTVANVQAMDYMHSELHDIENLGAVHPSRVLPAVDELENTQHGPFFSLIPVVSLMAGLLALGLGVALAISVIEPVHRMGLVGLGDRQPSVLRR